MNFFDKVLRRGVEQVSQGESSSSASKKTPIGDTTSDAISLTEEQLQIAKNKIKEARSLKASGSSSHPVPPPSDAEAKAVEDTSKTVGKFPFLQKKSAASSSSDAPAPSKEKEITKTPEIEINLISEGIMTYHGEKKGQPIVIKAIGQMEIINKALGEEIPNIQKATTVFQEYPFTGWGGAVNFKKGSHFDSIFSLALFKTASPSPPCELNFKFRLL